MISNFWPEEQKELLYVLHPESPIVNNYLLVFVILSFCICVCVSIIFSEVLGSKFRYDALKYFSVYFPRMRTFSQYSFCIRKLKLIQYCFLIYSLYSNFPNFPNNFLWSKNNFSGQGIQSGITPHLVIMSLQPLFIHTCICFMTLTFLSTASYYRMFLNLGLYEVFS